MGKVKKFFARLVGCLIVLAILGGGYSVYRHFKGPDDSREAATGKSMKLQEKLEQYAEVDRLTVREDEYGLLEATATVQIPEYRAIFDGCLEEVSASAKNQKDFEKKLFALAEKRVKEAMKDKEASDLEWTTREVTVELSLLDDKKAEEEWQQEELEALARRAAFEEELQSFALEIVQAYMADKVDWDAPERYREQAQNGQMSSGEEAAHE